MSPSTIACARCGRSNLPVESFCVGCGLPLGGAQADEGAGGDALGPFEAPDPSEPDSFLLIRDLVGRSGYDATASGHGWRMIVPLPLDRQQAVYIGHAGSDHERRSLLALVSVCGPANDRDARRVLKLNARRGEGHYAIKVLRGEEYFVVIHNLPADAADQIDAGALVRRIAEAADSLEDRLSRGRDLY